MERKVGNGRLRLRLVGFIRLVFLRCLRAVRVCVSSFRAVRVCVSSFRAVRVCAYLVLLRGG